MSMVTSCPACTTTFRISPEQLRARQGKVRCGRCKDVFDAFKTLASLPDEPVSESVEAEPPPAKSVAAAPVQPVLDIGPAREAQAALAYAVASVGVRAPGNKYALGAAFVLTAILVLQIAYALRTPLTAAFPSARPVIERACALIGCTVPLPRRTETLAIDASDLQAEPTRAGVIVLTAAVRNRGAMVVEYPALELTLTNAQDEVIARRIFLPRDYLKDPSEVGAGMQPRTEINVRIELDTGDLKAAGYRLFLFYP